MREKRWGIIVGVLCLVLSGFASAASLSQRYAHLYKASAPSNVENDIQHKARLLGLYDELFTPLQESRDMNAISPEDLKVLFRAARLTMFYAPSEALVRDMDLDLRALEAKGVATEKQYYDMFRALVKQRHFDEANGLRLAHPEIGVEKLPALEISREHKGPYTLRPVGEGQKLVAEKFDIVSRASLIVAIGSPVCHFTQNAIRGISADERLRNEFEEHAVWIAPQDDEIHLQELVDWNRSHPRQPMHIAYEEEGFSFVSSWSTPTFYFVRNGKVVSIVTGWPAEGNAKALLSAAKLLQQADVAP